MKTNKMMVVNGIRLNVVEWGKAENTCLLFLHGFPDFHHGWRHQAPFFESQNYHVVTPDQRGYNLSEKPKTLDDYAYDTLAQDIQALIDALGKKVWLIGHNWGGTVAWRVAQKSPDKLHGLILLNAPHPEVFWDHLKTDGLKGFGNIHWFSFQVPGLMENVFRMGNWLHFSTLFQKNARKGSITENDLKKYREAWSQPGAITAMLNWYRAFMRKKSVLKTSVKIEIPVLFLHGMMDKELNHVMVQKSLKYCLRATLKQLPKAGQWVHLDEITQVNNQIFEFINQSEYPYTVFTGGSELTDKIRALPTENKGLGSPLVAAKQMKQDGLSVANISKYTGLSVKEIEKL
jgi:pimeloyl-ACP methyl ester carboxylesterase